MHVRYSPTQLESLSGNKKSLPPPPKGYIWVYEADGLSGLGRFSLRKVVRAVTAPVLAVAKVVKSPTFKKVAKVAAIGAAAYFAAPWAATMVKSIGTAATQVIFNKRAANIPSEMSAEEAARADNELSTPAVPAWAATAANIYIAKQKVDQAAEQAAAAQAAQFAIDQRNAEAAKNRMRTEQAELLAMQRAEQQQAAREAGGAGYVDTVDENGIPVLKTKEKTPSWLLPAAIGGAALLMVAAS